MQQSAKTLLNSRLKCCRNAKMHHHTIDKSITHLQVSDLARLDALAQELHLSLAIAAGLEDWVLPSMVGVLVVDLRVGTLHDRVTVAPCHE